MLNLIPLAAGGPPVGLPEINPWLGMAIGMFLVFLNGFFVAAEFALVKVRPTQLQPYADRGHRRGKVARHMVRHLDAYLSATQLGITLSSLALGWIGEPAFAWIFGPVIRLFPDVTPAMEHSISLTAAFLVITILHIVLGELAPKSVAIRKPEPTSLWVAMPLYAFYKLSYPAIYVLNNAANAILRLVKIDPVSEEELEHDEEELRLLLATARAGRLTRQKRRLLDNVFELSHRTARQIMIPRADVVFLSTDHSLEENLAIARRSGHTRYPLCEGDLDQVIGLIHIKDLFRAGDPLGPLPELKRQIAFVPETLRLDRLLRRMLDEKLHMVAVLDEYGGVSGMVTFENVLEEIVGQIQDEFDREKPQLEAVGGGVYRVAGAMLIEDLERELEFELSDRDEDTIAGVVLSEIGRRPKVGDAIELAGCKLEALEVAGNRIVSLELRLPAEEVDPEP